MKLRRWCGIWAFGVRVVRKSGRVYHLCINKTGQILP